MRKEEKRIVENLFASPIEHKSGNVHRFQINEYLTLCRGKLLVGISMIKSFKLAYLICIIEVIISILIYNTEVSK